MVRPRPLSTRTPKCRPHRTGQARVTLAGGLVWNRIIAGFRPGFAAAVNDTDDFALFAGTALNPTNGALLAMLLGARVSYGRWLRFVVPGAILVAIVGVTLASGRTLTIAGSPDMVAAALAVQAHVETLRPVNSPALA